MKISDQLLAAREVLWDGVSRDEEGEGKELFICEALAIVNNVPFYCHKKLDAVKFLASLEMPLCGAGFQTKGQRTSSRRTQARRFDWLNVAALHAKELGL